jgi:hypothetical protein
MISPSAFRLRDIAATIAVATLVAIIPGWHLGYQSPAAYGWFWLLNTLLFVAVWALFETFFWSERLHETIIRLGVLTFSTVALLGLALGALKRLTPGGYLIALVLLVAVLLPLRARDGRRRSSAASGTLQDSTPRGGFPPVAILLVPVLILMLCYGWSHPPVGYDSLTYHLFFPARWLQHHALEIIPTPFGDQAPAYAPSNGELLYLWMMTPFHGDLIARVGQFPAYVFCAVAIYGAAQRLQIPRMHASYVSAFFLLSKPIIDQAVGADVDIVFAATFVAALYFALTATATGARSDIVLWGLATGLCLGTKYLGATYAPLLLALVIAPRVRSKAMWLIPGVGLLAAPWYIRNWIVGGSPLYPVGLTFGGVQIAAGAWTREVSLNNWAHLTDIRLLPGLLRDGAFGRSLFYAWLPFALFGVMILVARRRWLPLALAIGLPFLMCMIYWYVLPFNDATDTRYLFPAVALLLLLAGPSFGIGQTIGWLLEIAVYAALIWLIAVDRDAIVPSRFIWLYGTLASVLGILWRRLVRNAALAVIAAVIACSATFLVSVRSCPGTGCPLVTVAAFERPALFAGWDWIERHATPARIAYSGNNVPYRLLGPHLENAVSYVNIDRHQTWQYHDYEHAARSSGSYAPPQRPNLPYFRRHANYDEWLVNLRRQQIEYLFVTTLSTLLDADYDRDPDGFPIEASWAEAHRQQFTRVYENPSVRIYSINQNFSTHGVPDR